VALALMVGLVTGLSACKAGGKSAPDAQTTQTEPALAPGALMTYSQGGGITGKTTRVTVFADGRVEGKASPRNPRPQVRLPAARVEKLAAELAATGVFTEKDGAWRPSGQVADGIGARLAVRDQAGGVHVYESASGAKAPAAVDRALEVGRAFAAEVEPPEVPCACQPGDPRCSCL
jgi:hypothetical protein